MISYFHSTESAHTAQQFCLQIGNYQIMAKNIDRNGVDIKVRDICHGCDKSPHIKASIDLLKLFSLDCILTNNYWQNTASF